MSFVLAHIINKDLNAKITGQINGNATASLPFSVEEDANGLGVLRVVDGNPWAYDVGNDTKKVQYAPKTWTKTGVADNAILNLTNTSLIAKYYVIKGILVSLSDSTKTVKWELKDGVTTIAQGFTSNGSIEITSPIKISDGNAVTLNVTASGTAAAIVAATLIGETFDV